MSTSLTRRLATALAVVWVAIVAYLGLTGSRSVVGLPDELAQPTQHFVSFGVLSALLLIAFPGTQRRIFVALAGAGFVGELLQLTTDNREFALSDVGMNICGIAVGLLMVTWVADAGRVVLALAAVLLLAGPFVLPLESGVETSFPDKCAPAPPAAGGRPVILIDNLSGSGQHDVSLRRITEAIVETSEFSVEVWFDTSDLEQTGPARVFTISDGIDPDQLNFHIGVEGSSMSVRFRTSCQWFNTLVIDDVIKVDQLQHVIVSWSQGVIETWVDGERVDRTEVQWGDLTSWDSSFGVMIGNEFGGGRAFDGQVSSVSMWDRVLDDDTIAARNSLYP